MVEKEIVVSNESGIHARPASSIVKRATGFQADITFVHKGKTFNTKSMFSVMGMAADKGDSLLVQANGPDENEALEAMLQLVQFELE